MKHKSVKAAAFLMIGVLSVGYVSMEAGATGISSFLPAAGLALQMEEGSSQDDVTATSKSNAEVARAEKQENLTQAIKTENKEEKTSQAKTTSDLKVLTDKDATAKKSGEKAGTDEILLTETSAKSTEEKSGRLTKLEETGKTEAKEKEKTEEEEMPDEEETFSRLVIAKVTNYVNVRSIPSEEGEIVGKLYDKSVGDFIAQRNGWYKIKSGNVTGYVKAEFCVTGEDAIDLARKVGTRVATVNTTTLKVRKSASLDAEVLGLVPVEEELSVVEEMDGWVKVDIEEGYGYVSSDYVILRTDFVKAESKEEEAARLKKEEDAKKAAKEAAKKAQEKVNRDKAQKASQSLGSQSSSQAPAPVIPSGDSSLGQAVVDYAKQFVGNPYVYGGSSLTNGTDCSGFVMSVYKNFGVSLPHSSSGDRSQGYDVGGLANAQPGDIVCYSGHVGIYAGNGQIVHASTSRTGIIVSNANYRNVLAVRRIF